MGGVISFETNINESQYLKKFCDIEPICDNDPFWNHFFSFNLRIDPYDSDGIKRFNDSIHTMLELLMYNTPTTGNFAAFIRVILRRSTELKTSEICQNNIFLWQMYNALIIAQYVCKFLIQRLSENEFLNLFQTNLNISLNDEMNVENIRDNFESNSGKDFINALINIITELPLTSTTEKLHVETVKCLIILLSSQLYSDNPLVTSAIYSCFDGDCLSRSIELSKILMQNYLCRISPIIEPKNIKSESFVIGFATSLWSTVQSFAGLENGISAKNHADCKFESLSLGSLSLLLLLNLSCRQSQNGKPTVYRNLLSSILNSQEASSIGKANSNSFKLAFSILYDRLCVTIDQQVPMLLLYMLLHKNCGFRNYILSRINLEKLVVPVLNALYDGLHSHLHSFPNSHHVYLALIVILILSEDEFFCKIVHETPIHENYLLESERCNGQISLGGMIIIVFVRMIQVNVTKMRDHYLHANCLAALANMSPFYKDLPPVVCQKLIGLFESFIKRRIKLIESMRSKLEFHRMEENETRDYHQDIIHLEEGIRTILEIFNGCLTSNLRQNPHFIYSILYKRELFDALYDHPMFQDLLWNISAVINYFSARIQTNHSKSSIEDILEAIKKGSLSWPSNRLKKFPELKFKYVEDDNTVEFFVPYVWRLTYQFSSIYWDAARIKLFNALSVNSN